MDNTVISLKENRTKTLDILNELKEKLKNKLEKLGIDVNSMEDDTYMFYVGDNDISPEILDTLIQYEFIIYILSEIKQGDKDVIITNTPNKYIIQYHDKDSKYLFSKFINK